MPKILKFQLGVSNMYFVQDRGVIIIDTGFETTREKYIEAFSSANLRFNDITLIAVTHGHSDHFSFAGELKRMTGAPVLCHSLAVNTLTTGKDPEFFARKNTGKDILDFVSGLPLVPYSTVQPDLTFDAEFDLRPYGISGKAVYTPGHSDCSSSIVLDSGEAFVGDMLVDSPLTQEMRLAFLASDEIKLFESYKKLLGMAKMFYGGHGMPLSNKELLELIRKDGSREAERLLDSFKG